MTNKQTENKIAESFSAVKPDVYNEVASQCPERTAVRTQKTTAWGWKIATFALALILVVAVIFGGVTLGGTNAIAASVTLDVNPSVAIRLNKNRRVISVDALNLDGKKIIGNMDFKGAQLEVAVNALIGSMLRSNKLSADANSVLVSVDANQSEYDQLVNIVSQEINIILQESQIEASVVSQWLRETDDASALAAEYGISVGKAQLINKILQSSVQGKYTVEQLVSLKINELNLILDGLDVPQNELSQSGTASDGSYIGKDAAIAAALKSISDDLTENELQRLSCKMDFDDGFMIYEVEFVYNGWRYEIEVNALDGTIVGMERDTDDVRPQQSTLSRDQIEEKALDLADVPQADRDSVNMTVEVDVDHGVTEYELKFAYNGKYFEMEIDQYGIVLSASQRDIGGTTQSDLSYDQIKQKVLEAVAKDSRFASVTLSSAREWEIEREYKYGKQVYEVEFKWNGYEFDCVLDISTGNVTFKAEIDD